MRRASFVRPFLRISILINFVLGTTGKRKPFMPTWAFRATGTPMGFKSCGMEEEIQINPGGSKGSIVYEVQASKSRANSAIPGDYLSDKTNVTNVKHSGHATLGPELVTSGPRRVRIG